MTSFENALKKVLDHSMDYSKEQIGLKDCSGRVLAETIVADRDFPPFDRATKDGIAIHFDGIKSAPPSFKISGMAPAGSPQLTLTDYATCIEVMTGAIVPKNADTVVMYEHISEVNGVFVINQDFQKGQNIHYQASDIPKDEVLIKSGVSIGPAEIGVLASVGKAKVWVQKLPKVAVISTGNELVDVSETPAIHQIRKSNSHTLQALLRNEHITANLFHINDDASVLKKKLDTILQQYDVLLLSGGVSKGKFDFLPETFDALEVKRVFHKVLQRPGKPFWFGKHESSKAIIFSFPGNPVSTFVGYHVYFKPWLNKTLGVASTQFTVFLNEPIVNTTDLTLFVGAKINLENGVLKAEKLPTTGSGDLLALSKGDGFIQINPKETVGKGNTPVPFVPTRNIVT